MTAGRDRDEAFRRIVAAYDKLLLADAVRILCDIECAEDIVQDAFIKLSLKWKGEFEPSASMTLFLRAVVRNLALDALRQRERLEDLHRRQASERGEDAVSVTPPGVGMAAASLPERAQRAAEALASLSPRERELVTLKVYEEKSYKEIAEATGLTVGNVGFVLHGAMKKLARIIGEER